MRQSFHYTALVILGRMMLREEGNCFIFVATKAFLECYLQEKMLYDIKKKIMQHLFFTTE